MIPPDLPVTSVASPAPRRTAPENSGRASSGDSRPASSAYLPQRYLTRRHPPTPNGCLNRGKSPVNPHSHSLPGQRERPSNTRQRHMVVWIEERVRSNPIATLSLDNVRASERCP